MPTIVTRGVASARGAGTFSAAPPPLPPPPPSPTPPPPPPPGPVLQTVTFFNNGGSWTAPAGVTNLTSLNIIGGTSGMTAAIWVNTVGVAVPFYSVEFPAYPGSPSAFYTYAQVGAIADALLARINVGAPAERTFTYDSIVNYYNPNTGGYFDIIETTTATTRGYAYISQGPWDNRTAQPVRGLGSGWFIGGELYFPPQPVEGGPSSAFGYTAEGGAPPQDILQSNVPVVPGQTYTIEVSPSSGLVQFQFVQG